MLQKCESCIYCSGEINSNKEMIFVCKRYPPTVTAVIHNGGVATLNSVVHVGKSNWCGEYQETKSVKLIK